MIDFRKKHRVIRKKTANAVCGRPEIQAHDVIADNTSLPDQTRTFSMCFAGYDRDLGRDDMVYLSINTYWEPVTITLPQLPYGGRWYLCADTYGDHKGNYFYKAGKEVCIYNNVYTLQPRTVAVFVCKPY